MAYRSYVPWTKGGVSSSYTGGSSYSSTGSKTADVPAASSTSQYDGGYSRSRLASGSSSSSTPTYKSTYTAPPVSAAATAAYARDRSSTRDGAVKYSGSGSSSSFKEGDRLSLRDKYATGTYPGRSRESSLSSYDRKDADYAGRGLVRRKSSASRDPSPEVSSDVKASYVSTLSPYRLYGRSSYSRSNSRDAGADSAASSASSTPATTPVHVPTSLRFSTASRYPSTSSVRSPVSEKSPQAYVRSFSRSSSQQDREDAPRRRDGRGNYEEPNNVDGGRAGKDAKSDEGEVTQTTTFVTVVTRGTSPTPPSTSSFLRSRRAEMSRSIEKTIARPTVKPEMVDKEMQSDRGDDTSRTSRFSSRLSSSPWSSYLDRYSSNYSPVSRYSSRYGNYSSPSSAKSTDRDTSTASQLQNNDSKESVSNVATNSTVTKDNISTSPRISSESLAKDVVSQKVSDAMKDNNLKNSFTPTSDVENLKQSLKVIAEKSTLGSNAMTRSSPTVNSCPNKTGDAKAKACAVSNAALNHANSATNLLKKSSSDCNSVVANNTPVPKTSSNSSISTATSLTPSASKTLVKQGSPDSSNRKILPPSVPKGDVNTGTQSQALKPSSSLHSLNNLGIPNKDFRKSALNVELTNVLQAEVFKKMQAKQRKSGKSENSKRSNSMSSGESESLLVTGGSEPSLMAKTNSASKLRESKSLSKLHSNKNMAQQSSNCVHPGKKDKAKSTSVRRKSGTHSSSSSESTSSDETSSESSSSSEESSSDEETQNKVPIRSRQRSSQSSKTPENNATSNVASSSIPAVFGADEPSVGTEKPPRPPSSPRAQGKTEEAKSFLMRALAPVTNLFKGKSQETLDNNSADSLKESGEKMGSTQSLNRSTGSDQDDTAERKNKLSGSPKEGLVKIKSSKSISKLLESDKSQSDSEKQRKPKFKLRKQDSGERAWWLQSNPNIPEGIQRIASNVSLNKISDSENKASEEAHAKKTKNFKLRREESGEIPWWLDSNGEIPEGIQRIKSSHSMAKLIEENAKLDARNKEDEINKYKIRHQKSGEKAWWLKSNSDVPGGIMKLQSNKSLSDILQSELKAKVQKVGKDKSSTEDSSEESASEARKEAEGSPANGGQVPKFPLNLPAGSTGGHSPAGGEGEDPGRRSPYDNLQEQKHAGERTARSKAASKARPKHLPLFIGNHTNIDDILGSAATLVNPLIGLSKLRRGKGAHLEEEDYEDDEEDLEEVTPSQVRIHDGAGHVQRLGSYCRHVLRLGLPVGEAVSGKRWCPCQSERGDSQAGMLPKKLVEGAVPV